jgi:membrane associated rhomboid family serine protease
LAVRDDLLVIVGRRSTAEIRARDIRSVASIAGLQAEIEAAARDSTEGEAISRRIADKAARTNALADRPVTATSALMLVLVAVYLLQWFFAGNWLDTLVRMGANFKESWKSDHAYRLITANYLHASLIHIASNLSAISNFGGVLEKLIGTARVVVYAVSAIAGAFASSLIDGLAVGASTGAFGLMAAAVQTRHGSRLPAAFQFDRSTWITLVAVNGALPLFVPDISWSGHVAGAIGGGLTAALIARSDRSIDGGPPGVSTRVLAGLLVAFHVLGLAQGARYFIRLSDFPPLPANVQQL